MIEIQPACMEAGVKIDRGQYTPQLRCYMYGKSSQTSNGFGALYCSAGLVVNLPGVPKVMLPAAG